jgi:hypothetical protein
MRIPFIVALVLASAGAARADGWIHCDHNNGGGSGCDVGHEPASVGAGLALMAGLFYLVGRKRR